VIYEKSGPGLLLPSSTCSGLAEAGSISSGESFFTFPNTTTSWTLNLDYFGLMITSIVR
jgi:hypothetical protein